MIDNDMTAIDIVIHPTAYCDWPVISKWNDFMDTEHGIIFDFFQHCIDHGLILNQFSLMVDGIQDVWRYYSLDMINAKIFVEQFKNTLLNFSNEKFSMQGLWNHFEFDVKISLRQVDLDNEKNVALLVNADTGELWATMWPLTGGLSQYHVLETFLETG